MYRLFITQTAPSVDDWFILITLFVGIPSSVLNVQGLTANGLGKDVWNVPFDRITNFVYYLYVMECLYFCQIVLLKVTLIFFYLRIFPSKGVQKLLWITIGINAVYGVLFVFLGIFQCTPIKFYWEKWDNEHVGTCLNINGIGWSNAIISITLDVWLLAIPLWQLRLLKMHWKKKVGVAVMFCTGTL